MAAVLADLDSLDGAGGHSRRLGQEDLTARGDPGNAGGEVDRGPEPVVAARGGCSGVHTDAHRGKEVLTTDLVDDAQAEANGLARILAANHQRVADLLHCLGAMLWQQFANRIREVAGKVRCVLVPHRLREGGEAGQIREKKRVVLMVAAHLSPYPRDARAANRT